MRFLKYFTPKAKRMYLDYAAATPVSRSVVDAMRPYFSEVYGNPSAIHAEGSKARAAIDDARQKLARTLHVREEGIIFTASGTESNNLVIFGYLRMLAAAGREYQDMEVLTTKIEHPSITECMSELEKIGVKVTYLDLNSDGMISIDSLTHALSKKTALVTFAYANSEIGTIQDVSKISRTVRAFEREHSVEVAVHLDAAQAPLWLSCEIDRLGVDMLSLDAGKCEGPKGVGVLALRHGVTLQPYMHGGGQEFGLRSGTENTPLIVGASHAIVSAQASWRERAKEAKTTSERLLSAVLSIEGVVLNGAKEFCVTRLPNNINISIPGVDTEFTTIVLDTNGIAASTKSACSGASGGGSTVVREITGDENRAHSTLRMTHDGTLSNVECMRIKNILAAHIEKMAAHKEQQQK